MVWNCEACTFANSSEIASTCEICATLRIRHHPPPPPPSQGCLPPSGAMPALDLKPVSVKLQSSLSASKSTTQTTLFGRKVVEEHQANASSKLGKRKAGATSSASNLNSISSALTSKPAAAAFLSSTNNNNDVKITQYSTVRSHIPYQELYADAQRVLQETFGLAKLRNLQPAAIQCALQQKSQIIVMATGGGKSLCYQLPATVLGGVTLVISPLIALMQDQVQALNQKGIPAALVSSSQTETQNRGVLERLLGRPLLNTTTTTTTTTASKRKSPPTNTQPLPPLTLLYITPESIQTQRFRLILGELYQQRRIAMFAIDEAHCISR